MKKINELPAKTTPDNSDVLPIQDAAGITKQISRANFLQGISSGNALNTTITADFTADYRFDQMTGQQLTDYSTNNLHGTLGNAGTSDSQDPRWISWGNAGLDFVTDDYVSLPSRNWFSGNFYIEAIVYLRGFPTSARICDFGDAFNSNNNNVFCAISSATNGRPVLGIRQGSASTIVSPFAIPTFRWLHLGFEFASGTGRIYLNGVQTVSGSLPTPANVNRNLNFIGRSLFTSDGYLDGIISRLIIYNRALTNQERINNIDASINFLKSKGVYFI